jgi:hypothetical protein
MSGLIGRLVIAVGGRNLSVAPFKLRPSSAGAGLEISINTKCFLLPLADTDDLDK